VGRLVLADPDLVEETNLHRQPLFRMADIGRSKVSAARAALLALNPEVEIEALQMRVTPASAGALVAQADVVLDAADSLAVTYILSDACQSGGTPLVSAAVLGLAGYVGVFCGRAPSYRAVFPEMPPNAGSCATAGVLGTAVGVIGTLQAHLTLAMLLEFSPDVAGRLISVDFQSLHFGGFSFAGAHEPGGSVLSFIAPEQVAPTDCIIDLRTLQEAPVSPFAGALRIDAEALALAPREFPAGTRVVLCCRSGIRAWRAARTLQAQGHDNVALVALGG
jgi:molybdopterin/thiamine biosynthesis adenylyltransferase/rhodanese-related sulfurtransferase